ncbi:MULTISPECIES: hypothetical protein [Micrococcaceae]|uniref:Uncharacterized protein n=1 Tax=Arthrobacter rhombi TaxID=71253 RepID=A0A1R4EXE0_9MICC|nr:MULTISPECIES: hypothetical protein [Micrococcaceae]SJM48318.1 hypothetical protein FM101_01225 [Arthrobacter rhombi]
MVFTIVMNILGLAMVAGVVFAVIKKDRNANANAIDAEFDDLSEDHSTTPGRGF